MTKADIIKKEQAKLTFIRKFDEFDEDIKLKILERQEKANKKEGK